METLGKSILGERAEPLCAGAGEGQLNAYWASMQQSKLTGIPGSCLAPESQIFVRVSPSLCVIKATFQVWTVITS